MYNTKDNIVALATAPGRSALNVIRISGPNVLAFFKKITKKKTPPTPNYSSLYNLYNPRSGILLDQGLVVFFKKPKSYTGDNLIEISIHGGYVVAKKVLSCLNFLGARPALPGEFSYRSFINGKIDLIQAEATLSIINTNSDLGAYFSAKNLKGDLSNEIKKIKEKIIKITTYIEHELDFDENEIDFKTTNSYKNEIKKIKESVDVLLKNSFFGAERKNNLTACIVGKTNVGKSSLFNALCGYEKAIVTNVAGTTRDYVECFFDFDGLTINLIDTAGFRKGVGKIEKIGIKKTLAAIDISDFILFVDSKNPKKELQGLGLNLKNKDVFLIQNKTDKNKKTKEKKDVFFTSCLKKQGIKKLSTSLLTLAKEKEAEFLNRNKFVASDRIRFLLEDSQKCLKQSLKELKTNKDMVVVVSFLYSALDSFSDAISPTNKTDIINKIFGDFCVGK